MRHTALPSPGSEEQLRALAARVHSQRLDRSKPLWETWLVQGLEDNRFALISKTHHALVDGVSGVDLATVLFDLEPVPQGRAARGRAVGARSPSRARRSSPRAGSGASCARRSSSAAGRSARPRTRSAASRSRARRIEGVGEVAWAGLNPAPETPLNVPIGPHRRFVFVRNELADFKLVKDALGGTVNDVVLTVVAGALRHWLRTRGVRTEGLELRALVPVSIRTEGPAPPARQPDRRDARAAARLRRGPGRAAAVVREAMNGLKDSKQALGAEVLAGVQGFAPPTILAQASRINFSTRLFNLIVTNVPGPQFPLYVLGRELLDLFPIAFLPRDHALAIAIMSYNGGIDFGLLGDYDAMPDLEDLGQDLSLALEELVVAAKKRRRPRPRAKRKPLPASKA